MHHQRLMDKLRERIKDSRINWVISRMLKTKVVMQDGVKVATEEGVPQGGPLSPLLSNIVLDELDKELVCRGHNFVRYADDCNIYVASEKAGLRVMESVRRFIEKRLRLEVNESKSAVAKPEDRHFLGFRLSYKPLEEVVTILLSGRTVDRISAKSKQLTPRNYGQSIKECLKTINSYLSGWIGFFRICDSDELRLLKRFDAHIRRRLRAIQLKHWKRKKTIATKLVQLGAKKATAWRTVYNQRIGIWALSHSPVVDRTLNNAYWSKLGLKSLAEMHLSYNNAS